MDHDVDIEEHDVLDNPRIKDIFPDLSRVKTEIINPEDISAEEYNPNIQIKEEFISPEDDQDDNSVCTTVSNDINIPTVSNSSSDVLNASYSPAEFIERVELNRDSTQGVIAISMPAKTIPAKSRAAIDDKVLSPTAVISVVSAKSKNYATKSITGAVVKDLTSNSCSSKIILGGTGKTNKVAAAPTFPNKIILGTKIISKPIEIGKERLPAFVHLKDWGPILKGNACFCDDCKILFPTKNTLDAHNATVHSLLVASKEIAITDTDYDSDVSRFSGHVSVRSNKISNRVTNTANIQSCDDDSVHSAKSFRNSAKIILNLSNKVSGEQCYHCNKFFANNAALIKHLYALLPDKNNREVPKVKNASKSVINCHICDEPLHNDTIAKFHFKYVHPNVSDALLISDLINDNKSEAEVINKSKVKGNILKIDSALSKVILSKKRNLEYIYSRKVIKNPPIPISVLFKCFKCDIHYVHAKTCKQHYHHCNGISKVSKLCKKCKRRIRQSDVKMHELQHLVTKVFKVYTINSVLPRRLLCRCPKCNVHFDESSFWEHVGASTCVKKCIYCNKCNLYIDRDSYMKTAHAACGNNIVIDYFDDVNNKSKRHIVSYQEKKIYKYWICEICKRCGSIDGDTHMCQLAGNTLCQRCGLYFSKKTIIRHLEIHSEGQMSLQNFLLHSLQKRKFIQPLFPNHKCCVKCKVHYLNYHTECASYKVCEFCSKRFALEYYEIHKEFHTYNLDDVIGEAVRIGGYVRFRSKEYVYYCVHCKSYSTSYDNAVRHAQSHVRGKPIAKRVCSKCDRNFDAISYEGHKHVTMKAIILNFDYKVIASDAWYDLFNGIDQVEIGTILIDSVFKDTRCLDLTVVQKGDPEKRIYVCSSCSVVVEKTALEKHASNKQYCWENRKYKCDLCDLYFYSPGTIEAHKNLHSTGVKKEDFCVIYINSTDAGVLVKRMGKAAYNFASKIETPVSKNVLINEVNNSDEDSEIGNEDDKSQSDYDSNAKDDSGVEMIQIYKCIKCKACRFSRDKIHDHECNTRFLRFCQKCKQFYNKRIFANHHLLIHKNKKNKLMINYFQITINSTGQRQLSILKVQNTNSDSDVAKQNSAKGKPSITDNDIDDMNTKKNRIDYAARGEIMKLEKALPKRIAKNKDVILYKCTNCNVCTITNKGAENHTCSIDFYKRFCNICQEVYTSYNWNRHKVIHMGKRKLNVKIKHFKPDKILYSNRVTKMLKDNSNNTNTMTPASSSENESVKVSDDKEPDEIVNEIKHNTETKNTIQDQMSNTKTEIKNYQCNKCGICILRWKYALVHTCVSKYRRQFCISCKRYYHFHTFGIHKRLYCRNKNVQIEYFTPGFLLQTRENKRINTKKNITCRNETCDEESNVDNSKCGNNKDSIKHIKVYKCVKCKFCVFSCSNLYRHVCSLNAWKKFCDMCQQWFGRNSWNKHNNMHSKYKIIKFKFQYFQPKNLGYQKRTVKGNENTGVYNPERDDDEAIDESNKATDDDNVSEIEFVGNVSNDVAGNATKSKKDDAHVLYMCDQCDICYMNRVSRSSHVHKNNHMLMKSPVQCIYCKLNFPNLTHEKHKLECPFGLGRGYIKIYDLDKNVRIIRKSTNKAINNDFKVKSISADSKTNMKYIVRDIVIFKCINCDVCTMQGIGRHTCKNDNTKQFCKICKLFFWPRQFRRHLKWHRDTMNIKKNIIVKMFKPKYGNQCAKLCDNNMDTSKTALKAFADSETSVNEDETFVDLNNDDYNDDGRSSSRRKRPISKSSRSYSVDEDYRPTRRLRKVDLAEIRKVGNSKRRSAKFTDNLETDDVNMNDHGDANIHMPETVTEDDINIISDWQDTNNSNIADNTQKEPQSETTDSINKDLDKLKSFDKSSINQENSSTSTINVIPETKLYNCNSCDVYFLQAQCCQEHVLNHIRLDARDYIQCKLCLLQFLIVDLHMHMVTHHKDDFNFENVTVVEYLLNGKEPRIYNLKDKVQSLIISTTCVEAESSTS